MIDWLHLCSDMVSSCFDAGAWKLHCISHEKEHQTLIPHAKPQEDQPSTLIQLFLEHDHEHFHEYFNSFLRQNTKENTKHMFCMVIHG